MPGAVPSSDGLEAVDMYFIEPGVDLLVEVGFGVNVLAWWASCPSGCEVLTHGEAAVVALGGTVMSSDALVRPVLGACGQFIIPNLYKRKHFVSIVNDLLVTFGGCLFFIHDLKCQSGTELYWVPFMCVFRKDSIDFVLFTYLQQFWHVIITFNI